MSWAWHLEGWRWLSTWLEQEEQAWNSLKESLRIAVETHSRFTLFILPAALVVLLADAGRWEQAVEAYSAVMTDPMVSKLALVRRYGRQPDGPSQGAAG